MGSIILVPIITRMQTKWALRDLRRDWRRWTPAERVGAVVCALVTLVAPTALLLAGPPL
jgi:hypothetical protein